MNARTSLVAAVQASNITKRFGDVFALRDVSVCVPAGIVTALLGPNGAGKTTLLHLATGLLRSDGGSVLVLGKPPCDPEIRQRAGVMLQRAQVPGMLEVAEALALVSSYYEQPYHLDETLRLAGLEQKARARIWTLSPGYKQRVHFALAICGDPDLLLLDEPTAYMDAASRELVWDYIEGAKRRGKTTLVTTHTVDEAETLSDRVVVLNQGRVVADAAISDLRREFATSRVSFDVESLSALPDESYHVQRDGARLNILTADPARTVEGLSRYGLELNGLRIERTRLEDIVSHLLNPGHEMPRLPA